MKGVGVHNLVEFFVFFVIGLICWSHAFYQFEIYSRDRKLKDMMSPDENLECISDYEQMYEKGHSWKNKCWVKSLDRLQALRADPNIIAAYFVTGTLDGIGHAWIAYTKKEQDGIHYYVYDPVYDRFIGYGKQRDIRICGEENVTVEVKK